MDMPKRRNDAALTKGARCLHAPMMGKLSDNLGTVCLEVLGDLLVCLDGLVEPSEGSYDGS